jgi:hypothetical protein
MQTGLCTFFRWMKGYADLRMWRPRRRAQILPLASRQHLHMDASQHVCPINYQDLEVFVVNTTATLLVLVCRAAPGCLDFKQMSPSRGGVGVGWGLCRNQQIGDQLPCF